MTKESLTYRDAGVDIAAGNALVERIKPLVAKTRRPEVLAGLGGFGGMFALPPGRYREPVLLSGTDGVGTKLVLARDLDRHDTIGIDLVAMCVNDIVVHGAEPLFFLDYFATGKLATETAAEVVAGIAAGCEEAGCALIGGETAEMPGMYGPGEYDLAGFTVGAVERSELLDGRDVRSGDVLLGWASSGVHSNGFSLVRRIIEVSGASLSTQLNDTESLGEALLRPTQIYVQQALEAIAAGGVRGLAHITGGGLTENVIRSVPDGLGVQIDSSSWPRPELFAWLQEHGNVAEDEMHRTFNCGIGMVSIISADALTEQRDLLARHGIQSWPIGYVVEAGGEDRVLIT